MNYVNENGLDPIQVMHLNRIQVKDMDELTKTVGWQQLCVFLDAELAAIVRAMDSATTGDMALKATAAFTALKQIRYFPDATRNASIKRIQELEKEALEVEKKPSPRNRMP